MIIRVALAKYDTLYDYLSEQPCTIGCRVLVPFGDKNQLELGIVFETPINSSVSINELKSVIQVIDDQPIIPQYQFILAGKISQYYRVSIAKALFIIVPSFLLSINAKPLKEHQLTNTSITCNEIILNQYQDKILLELIDTIKTNKQVFLQGVTGSGKTRLYLALALYLLKQNKQVLLLVPEINLIETIVTEISLFYKSNIYKYYGSMKLSEKKKIFSLAKSGEPMVLIGTRSAIWLPFTNIGLICIDEEQDDSYKEEFGIYCKTSTIASFISTICSIPIVYGSATPSIELCYSLIKNKQKPISLNTRINLAPEPEYVPVLINNQYQDRLDPFCLLQIKNALSLNQQVLIYVNQRGYARRLWCLECKKSITCINCDYAMVMHQKSSVLICHVCSYSIPIPSVCHYCSKPSLVPFGSGVDMFRLQLAEIFGDSAIVQIDRDHVNKNELFTATKAPIIIGTKMTIKGHNYRNVTTCVYIHADQLLAAYDVRALEILAMSIVQLGGRSTRHVELDTRSKIFIPTFLPNHPLFLMLQNGGYNTFVSHELESRRLLQLPPFTYISLIKIKANPTSKALKQIEQIRFSINQLASFNVFGPIEAPISRIAGKLRYNIMIKSKDKAEHDNWIDTTISVLKSMQLTDVHWVLDVEPISLE
ncbi:MAG: primosomal protein N' [Methylacidiphilales bacterium]|nr:primosomal protein N' [Candidatus Methylacidiphilales bacterium]